MSLQDDLVLLFSSVANVHSRNLKNKQINQSATKGKTAVVDGTRRPAAGSGQQVAAAAVSSLVSSLASVTPCPSTTTATVHPMRENVPASDSPSQGVPSTNSLSICITGTCSSDTNKSRSAVPPKDLGTFRTLVSGWETVTSPKQRHGLFPNLSSSSLNTNFECNSLKSVASAAREQFFQNEANANIITNSNNNNNSSINTSNNINSNPASALSHRFAGVDRLANRSAIYDTSPSPDGNRPNLVVSLLF